MTLTADNAKKMLFTLRYPPDKILRVYEGSFTANPTTGGIPGRRTHHTIPHPFGDFVLVDMTYSLDGGASWQDRNIAIPDTSGGLLTFQTLEASAYSTTSTIVVVASNYQSSPRTVLYRVVALAKD